MPRPGEGVGGTWAGWGLRKRDSFPMIFRRQVISEYNSDEVVLLLLILRHLRHQRVWRLIGA